MSREWIIDDDDVEPASGHTGIYGSGETATSLIRLEIKYSVAIGCQTRHREDVAVTVPTDYANPNVLTVETAEPSD